MSSPLNLTRACLPPHCVSTLDSPVRGAHVTGGCVVDLDGGEWLVSSTVTIPSYVSNMKIEGGSLVANPLSPTWNATARRYPRPSTPRPYPRTAHNGGACDATAFPHNLTGMWCQNLSPGSGTTAELCQQACCDEPSCEVWQFCPTTHECFNEIPQKISCWLGSQNSCKVDPVPSGVRTTMHVFVCVS